MTQIFNQKIQTERRRWLRREMPKGEKLLWWHLRNNQLGYKFRRQAGVGPFIADFYSSRLRLAIEVDGLTHETEDAVEYDRQRDAYFRNLGITVKRYTSVEVFQKLDVVKQDIYDVCVALSKTSPLPLLRKEGIWR